MGPWGRDEPVRRLRLRPARRDVPADPRPLLPGNDPPAGAWDDIPRPAGRSQEEGHPLLRSSLHGQGRSGAPGRAACRRRHVRNRAQARRAVADRSADVSSRPGRRADPDPRLSRKDPGRRRGRKAPRGQHRRARAVPLRRRAVGDAFGLGSPRRSRRRPWRRAHMRSRRGRSARRTTPTPTRAARCTSDSRTNRRRQPQP